MPTLPGTIDFRLAPVPAAPLYMSFANPNLLPMIIYGIKNCNTVKSALGWLDKKKVAYEFHDFKSKGITTAKLKEWCKQVGWETLVNKKGMTWRKLGDGEKARVTNQKAALDLMASQPSVIKRPVVEVDGKIMAVGFDEEEYKKITR